MRSLREKAPEARLQLQQAGREAVVLGVGPALSLGRPRHPKGQEHGGEVHVLGMVCQDSRRDPVELEAVRQGDVRAALPDLRFDLPRGRRGRQGPWAVADDVGRLLEPRPLVGAAAAASRPFGQRAQLGEPPHGAPAAQGALGELRQEGQVEPHVVDDNPLHLPVLPEFHQIGPILDEVRHRGDVLPQGQEPFGRQAVDAEEIGVEGFGREVEAIEERQHAPRSVEDDRRGGEHG